MGVLTYTQIKDRISADGVDDTLAGQIANQVYNELVTRAKYLQKKVTLGTTVVDQSEYSFPETDLVQIEYVYVGTTRYERCSYEQLKELQNGRAYRTDTSVGAVAPWFDSSGAKKFELYPTPTEADLTIVGIATDEPTALSSGSSTTILPGWCDQVIIDKSRAVVYDEEDELGGERDRLEAMFEAAIEKLRRYNNARIGRGPVQARVRGVHFR